MVVVWQKAHEHGTGSIDFTNIDYAYVTRYAVITENGHPFVLVKTAQVKLFSVKHVLK